MPLAEIFLRRYAEKYHRPLDGLDDGAAEVLKSQRWSGNIRELQNCMEKAVILSEGTRLTAKDIKTEHTQAASAPTGNLRAISDDEEERLVRQAMERTGGNISAAAKMLGVSRPTLYTKLKKYGL